MSHQSHVSDARAKQFAFHHHSFSIVRALRCVSDSRFVKKYLLAISGRDRARETSLSVPPSIIEDDFCEALFEGTRRKSDGERNYGRFE
jgi:hypothetical protein